MNCSRTYPTPGTMRLCASGCPHHRPAKSPPWQCDLNKPMKIPPLTELKRDGTEICGWWPPKYDELDQEPTLFAAAGDQA